MSFYARQSGPSEIRIRSELRCGDLGRIISLHGTAYEPLDGFGIRFEAYVARTVAEYILDNEARGCIWLADGDDVLAGCAAVAERAGNIGQLRWVLVDARMRGTGLGGELIDKAIDYCKARRLERIRLETTEGLPVSMSLYRRLGFRTTSEDVVQLWDGPRTLIKMEKALRQARM